MLGEPLLELLGAHEHGHERLAPVIVLGAPVALPQRVHDELRHEPRLARRRAGGEERARACAGAEVVQPRTQRACVAHGERLAVGIVPLHADGHALRERVELLAGEGVGDVRVLRAQTVEVPRAHRREPGVDGHRRQPHRLRAGDRLGGERKHRLHHTDDARDVLAVEGGHRVLVAFAGEGGACNAGEDPLDAVGQLAGRVDARLRATAAAQHEHLGRKRVERLPHARNRAQPREQLVAHGVLKDAPAALVVWALVVQRVDAVAQLGAYLREVEQVAPFCPWGGEPAL